MATARAVIHGAGAALLLTLALLDSAWAQAVQVRPMAWQQVEQEPQFTLALERRQYTPLDGGGRIVLAVQAGRGKSASAMTARWAITRQHTPVLQGEAALDQGLAVIDFDLAALAPGSYVVIAEWFDAGVLVQKKQGEFELLAAPAVAPRGRVPLILPRGVQAGGVVAPLTFGVPLPKGALRDTHHLRVVDAQGRPVPAQFTVRSRWGYHEAASVRWLGVDLQSPSAAPWWPKREAIAYYLEYGDHVAAVPVDDTLRVQDTEQGLRVDTGALQFLVRRQGFNLIDEVTLHRRPMLSSGGADHGPYVIDHEGAIYRPAHDRAVSLAVEEQGPLRVVIRAEGWYVKQGSDGSNHGFALPTDRISRFVTRIEAYRGLPVVRVLHTWIMTYDSFSVRLRDVGFSLPLAGASQATFGVLDHEPIRADVPGEGVRLVQHRHDRFDVERGSGQALAAGRRSDGNLLVRGGDANLLGLSLRETWQRFPKEFEVLPDQVRLHVWPAHGRVDPSIDPFAPDRYHQLWFVHQGRELDLRVPWAMLFAAMRDTDNPSTGIYAPGGTAIGGVHASAMGASITSDFLLTFALPEDEPQAADHAAVFQQRPHALAHPDWLAASGAMGPVHPYDPAHFASFEDAAARTLRAYRDLQDHCQEFGMFLYRVWHHGHYQGEGRWNPYRLYSAGHHYEPYLPWLYYARSGDPEHFDHGLSTARQVSDLGVIHHEEPQYVHREYWSRQARLLGSTRHTNGTVLWGGDHAVLGHLTTYNGFITAHYLSGDLRLREIVVDQWQRTLLERRDHAELAKAVRLGPGRDNNNALGELIDLYQLTYDPRLLAYIEPCLQRFTENMMIWGLPLQNVLQFSGDPRVRENLLAAAQSVRQSGSASSFGLQNGYNLTALLALASLHASDRGYAADALLQASAADLPHKAHQLEQRAANAVAMCTVPDDLLYLPSVLAAVDAERRAGTLGQVVSGQTLPIGGAGIDANFTRIVARQQHDADFTIHVKGHIQPPGIPLRVYAPDGTRVLDATVPPGGGESYTLSADGQVGDYVIFLQPRDAPRDRILAPLTSLPQEVYVMGYWSQAMPSRFFTRLANVEGGQFAIKPHASAGVILSADLAQTLAATQSGEPLQIPLPTEGAWLNIRSVYVSMPKGARAVLALDPPRFFEPAAASLSIAPQ